ncbi:disease resistance protein RUN1-like [Rhodamnia argentea]|uniref:Disease resistance protein RUN1-like n=1 Tax=Rhodamnia argentea TaxID=178133 RepID=A0ABM3HAW4_9MYRT|nr:disease resistance protein RUN1-like [Rhodamnia argentea]
MFYYLFCRNAEDGDSGASGSPTALTETNSGSFSLPETNDSASSSSIELIGNHYDVFLSFRGPDTREGFTDHLYNGLVDAGIRAFRDDNELRQGEKIGPDLLSSIQNSKILIPILSVNYGSSKWCLDELVQIMECKNSNMRHIVLPIFYKVEPAHIRYQSGSFGDAFRRRFIAADVPLLEFWRHILHALHAFWRHISATPKRDRRPIDPTVLEKWKQALKEVSSLKGWEAKGYEGVLVRSVVQKVLRELKKDFELVIPENLVGIDNQVEKVMEFVDNHASATLFVGIYGMGGIGKTTFAKTIYNKLSNQFENCSFIADIGVSCQHNGLEYLQNQLIFDILMQKDQICNKDEGTKFISSKFGAKKVLILLDDVDEEDQLEALAGSHKWFSSGSRILITTRNKSILDNGRVDYHYELEELDMNQSLILFSRHAFRMNSPPMEFEDLTHKVVSTTRRAPLCLEVLGSFLCGKGPTIWRGFGYYSTGCDVNAEIFVRVSEGTSKETESSEDQELNAGTSPDADYASFER